MSSLSTLLSSPPSLLESLFLSSFLSGGGEGEDDEEEEEEELEEEDEEEDDLWGWAAALGGWTSFSLGLFSTTSLCLAVSLETERLRPRC